MFQKFKCGNVLACSPPLATNSEDVWLVMMDQPKAVIVNFIVIFVVSILGVASSTVLLLGRSHTRRLDLDLSFFIKNNNN